MNSNENIYGHIDMEYRHLHEIRKNIAYLTRRLNGYGYNRHLNTTDIRLLVESHTQLYNSILQHIEFLYDKIYTNPSAANRPPSVNVPPLNSNYAFINGRYYHIDSIEQLHPTSNTHYPTPSRQSGHRQASGSHDGIWTQPNTEQPITGSSTSASSIRSTPIQRYQPRTDASQHRQPSPSIDDLIDQLSLSNTTSLETTRRRRTNPSFFETLTTELLNTFNEPVTVAPTEQQIQNATTDTVYSEIENPLNQQCPISLETFSSAAVVTQIIPCRHVFTPSSLSRWFQSNVKCPVCRYDIRTYLPEESYDIPPSDEDMSPTVTSDSPSNEPHEPSSVVEPHHIPSPTDEEVVDDTTIDTFLVDAIQNALHRTSHTSSSEDTSEEQSLLSPENATRIGASILNSLMTNDIDNVRYDASTNMVTFETVVWSDTWDNMRNT